MIVDWAVYIGGARQERHGGLHDTIARLDKTIGDAGPDQRAFLWLGLHDPAPQEMAEVAEELDLHPLAVEDAVHAHQRPKVERYGDDLLFVVLKTLRYVERTSDVELGEVAIFLSDRFCVTVRHGKTNPVADARRRYETSSPPEVLECGSSGALYVLCDSIVDTYTRIAGELENDLEELEASVFSTESGNDAEPIYALKREVLEFRRAVRPLAEPVARLGRGAERAFLGRNEPGNARGDETALSLVHPDVQHFFRDVADHLHRAAEAAEVFAAQLTDILNANLAQVGVRQNDDMRKISAWAAMITVPTFIAGLYGMNFENMPELGSPAGYPLAVVAMALAAGLLYRAFKRSGWL